MAATLTQGEKAVNAGPVVFSRRFRYKHPPVWLFHLAAAIAPSVHYLVARPVLVAVLLTGLVGCNWFSSREGGDSEGYWLPLTVKLRLDPSVTEAELAYRDACGQPRTFPIGDRLKRDLERQIGLVFEHLQTESSSAKHGPPDGTVEVALGLKEVELLISRKGKHQYPATVTVGATVSYIDAAGALLHTKKLRTDFRDEIEVKSEGCEVHGLDGVAYTAVGTLAQGLKEQLGNSIRIREAAEEKAKGRRPTVARSQADAGSATIAGPAQLSFRAMLVEEHKNQVLESGEKLTVTVEVTNAGPGVAQQVQVMLDGSPALVQRFTNPIEVGDLQPGETKVVEASGKVPPVSAAEQAELVISLSSSGDVQGPAQKKFVAALRPAKSEQVELLSVDVDQVPERVPGYERRKAVGIAIGVGTYRDPQVPGVKFAVRDAEVVASYFRTVGGIPARQVKMLTDGHALKDDLAQLFEGWLPQHVGSDSVVLVFFSGRASMDPSTGAVSLIPHDGSPAASPRLFSLRRLHAALAGLSIQRAVLLLDVSLTVPSTSQNHRSPVWDTGAPGLQDGKLVQILGIHGIQNAHQYEQGQHGLFTYYLLKGLGGTADKDRDGIVAVGEIFDYLRVQVPKTAKAEYGNEQEPSCVPVLTARAPGRGIPLARVR